MNVNKGLGRLMTVFSLLLLGLGVVGTIVCSDGIWAIWGIICSVGIWLIYGSVMFIIKGFADTNGSESSKPTVIAKQKTGRRLSIAVILIKPVVKFFTLVLSKIFQKCIRNTIHPRFAAVIFALAILVTSFYACTHMVGSSDT